MPLASPGHSRSAVTHVLIIFILAELHSYSWQWSDRVLLTTSLSFLGGILALVLLLFVGLFFYILLQCNILVFLGGHPLFLIGSDSGACCCCTELAASCDGCCASCDFASGNGGCGGSGSTASGPSCVVDDLPLNG